MSAATRAIVVDDTDPAIQYSSGWFNVDPSKLNTLGNYGPVYNSTSHGTTTTGSDFTFSFTGTSITVMGTIDITTDSSTKATDPTWSCFVDEIPISNPNPTFQFPENNWQLCQLDEVAAGSHTLTVQVTSKGQVFYLDKIMYTPTSSVKEEQAVVQYLNTDPSVSFGSGWQPWGAQNVTQTKGAQVALNFHGTSASLYGYVPTELPHNASSATYTIDGGDPIPFALEGLSVSGATAYNTLFFTTETLASAAHNLVVTYQGNGSYTPLVVGSFFVTNTSTLSSTSSSSASTPSSSSDLSTSPTSSKSSSSPVGAIIGGTAGCVLVLALIAGFIFCRRRRRRTNEQLRRTSANPFTNINETAQSGSAITTGAQYSYSVVSGAGEGYYPSPRADTPGFYTDSASREGAVSHSQGYPLSHSHASPATPPTDVSNDPAHAVGSIHRHQYNPSESYSASSSASARGDLSPVRRPQQDSTMLAYLSPRAPPSSGSSASASDAGAGRGMESMDVALGLKLERERLATAAFTANAYNTPALAPLTGTGRPVVLRHHQDSGVRINTSQPELAPEIFELPPGYSAD